MGYTHLAVCLELSFSNFLATKLTKKPPTLLLGVFIISNYYQFIILDVEKCYALNVFCRLSFPLEKS